MTITPGDSRYESMLRGYNHRFIPRPGRVHVAHTARDVVAVVGEAVAAGKRIAVRSGGHCFEDFAASPDIDALVDMSQMAHVHHDQRRRAFAVEAGATLGGVYETLFKNWGLTIPGGTCPDVGIGGHIAGGGFGTLSRTYGTVVDHLYAVEVVVVGRSGRPRVIVATRDPADPHRDLWWAHTGGGGGNFGVVTRYWLRDPAVTSADPAELLPKAPGSMRTTALLWPWRSLSERDVAAVLRNFGRWCGDNGRRPDTPNRGLVPILEARHRSVERLQAPGLFVGAVIDETAPGARERIAAYFADVTAGVEAVPARTESVRPWLEFVSAPPAGSTGADGLRRFKTKGAFLRREYTERQLAAIHRHLTAENYRNPAAHLLLIGYGGKINSVAPGATASPHRNAAMIAEYSASWATPAEDDANLAWLREFYRDVYADTGGVPGFDEVSDGSYINYPDIDLADPRWNTSGLPWHTLYYKDNYARLREIKRRYDPRQVWRHALSVQPDRDGSGRQ
ncbi:FAD-dependent oxidoreductase [Streptomyces capparidis]